MYVHMCVYTRLVREETLPPAGKRHAKKERVWRGEGLVFYVREREDFSYLFPFLHTHTLLTHADRIYKKCGFRIFTAPFPLSSLAHPLDLHILRARLTSLSPGHRHTHRPPCKTICFLWSLLLSSSPTSSRSSSPSPLFFTLSLVTPSLPSLLTRHVWFSE